MNNKKEDIVLLLSHKLNTIINSDIIFVIESGKIVEQGKHDN